MKLHVERVHLDRGGYDRRGRYWGVGERLYRVSDAYGDLDEHIRAPDAKTARKKILSKYGTYEGKLAVGHFWRDPSKKRRGGKTRRDTHRFTASERSGRASALHRLAKKGGSHTYATPEVKRTASYKRAERLEEDLAPRRWNTPGLTRSQYERLADAWERAGFLGWADNYRAHVEQHRIGRDRGTGAPGHRKKGHHHRTKGAPPFATQQKISRKIRLLVREGYSSKQAAAIAYRMYGVARPRTKTKTRGNRKRS